MRLLLGAVALIAGISGLPASSSAKVVKFDILRVELPTFEGRVFGKVGTYDRIVARATIAVSPDDPHNKIIVDLDRAPRNAQGLVEAVTDVEILRPTVAANGNRRLFYEALNRGNKLGLALFNDSPAVINDLAKATNAGNGFLMNRGYTLVWSGWQGDVAPGGGRMMFSPPVVPDVTGLAREDFVFDHMDNPASAPLSYPAADLDAAHAKISVRQREADSRATPAGLEVKFEGPTKISIRRPDGFDAGAIYEFIYTARDPKVMGLGFAATRDVVSFLRNETADSGGIANPLSRPDRPRHRVRRFAKRSLSARLPLSRLQHRRNRPRRVRRIDAAHLGRQEDLHELSFQSARPLALSACRHVVSRRGLSLHLSRDYGCPDRKDEMAFWRAALPPTIARKSSRPTARSNSISSARRWW